MLCLKLSVLKVELVIVQHPNSECIKSLKWSSSFGTARKGNGPKLALRQFDVGTRLRNGLLRFAQTQFSVGILNLESVI